MAGLKELPGLWFSLVSLCPWGVLALQSSEELLDCFQPVLEVNELMAFLRTVAVN